MVIIPKPGIMKKILFWLFFVVVTIQNNYSQSLHHSKRKQTITRSLCKREADSCLNNQGIIIDQPVDEIRNRARSSQMPGPVLFHPVADDVNKWMLVWSRTLKGFHIACY